MSLFGIENIGSRPRPTVGIIGGSGMCSFSDLKVLYQVRVETKYGFPSSDILVCEYMGVVVAFLPRHGEKHTFAPHKVPYKANISALRDLGVRCVVATCIAGSLKRKVEPGSFVIPDQFVNLTWGRDDYVDEDGGNFSHLPMADPYCEEVRRVLFESVRSIGGSVHKKGTVVVIQGPRFSTKAESLMFMSNGWDIVNMTQYPECYFAKELGICYGVLASVTDYDVGLQDSLSMNSDGIDKVLGVFHSNITKTKDSLLYFLRHFSRGLSCNCSDCSIETYYQ